MAEKYPVKLRNVSNVAASKTALIDIPVGPRYHAITLEHGYTAGTNTIAGGLANILEVRVIVNDRVQRVFSGVQLRDLNVLNGVEFDCQGAPNTAPGISLPIYFAEPWRKDSASQDALAWQSRNFKSFRIEVDLSTAGTPTLVASAVIDQFVATDSMGKEIQPLFVTVRRQQVAAAGTSFDITTIDKKGLLQQINLYTDSTNGALGNTNASIVTVRRDGQIVRELTYSANIALLLQNTMTPTLATYTNLAGVAAPARTAKMFDLVFDHDDLLNSSLNLTGAKEFTLTVEAAAAMAGSVTFLVQRYGPLE